MFDLDPRDLDSRDEERYDNKPSRGSRGGDGDGDRVTTGGNQGGRATGAMTPRRWVVGPATTAHALTRRTTRRIAAMTHGGWTATESPAHARPTRATRSGPASSQRWFGRAES
jgi:hypothetical protein